MTHIKKIPALCLSVVIIVSAFSFQVFADELNGWVDKYYNSGDPVWYYYENGSPVTGWKQVGKKWYYFEDDGRLTDIPVVEDDGKLYVLSSGALVTKTGWVSCKYGGYTYWFYVKKGGVATTGWKKISKKWYYFDEVDGFMYHDTVTTIGEDSTVYVFNSNGQWVNKQGWLCLRYSYCYTPYEEYGYKVWYYLDKNGVPLTGLQKIGDKYYYFNSDGSMRYSTSQVIDGVKYIFDETGACVKQVKSVLT